MTATSRAINAHQERPLSCRHEKFTSRLAEKVPSLSAVVEARAPQPRVIKGSALQKCPGLRKWCSEPVAQDQVVTLPSAAEVGNIQLEEANSARVGSTLPSQLQHRPRTVHPDYAGLRKLACDFLGEPPRPARHVSNQSWPRRGDLSLGTRFLSESTLTGISEDEGLGIGAGPLGISDELLLRGHLCTAPC